jgi:hypothetical protein
MRNFEQKMIESKSLGGLHGDTTAQQLEMSCPSLRAYIHQATDMGHADELMDLMFAIERENAYEV